MGDEKWATPLKRLDLYPWKTIIAVRQCIVMKVFDYEIYTEYE